MKKFSTIEEFVQDSKEWMKTFDYSLGSSAGDKSWLCYTSNNIEDDKPSVTIHYNNGSPTVDVMAGTCLKLFSYIKAHGIGYRHPRLNDWINYFQKLEKVLEHEHKHGALMNCIR